MSNDADAPSIHYAGEWPHLTVTQLAVIISANIGSLLLAWILLRVVWKTPTEEEIRCVDDAQCNHEGRNAAARESTGFRDPRCI
jgi:uncharacterized membrane-anchored protein